jgi:hypothetical protein
MTRKTLLFVAAALLACQREAPPVAQEAKAPIGGAVATAPAAPPGAPAAPAAATADDAPALVPAAGPGGTAKYDEGKFVLTLEPAGEVAAGKSGVVNVVLVANPPFHTNKEYPYKFKGKDSPGVKFAAPVVTKDSAKLETQRLTMPVSFTADKAGKATVAGQFAFSVCTDETCLIEKRDLSLTVDVK